MDFYVEIGTLDVQEVIKTELSLYSDLIDQSDSPPDLRSIYVTSEFEAAVRRLEVSSAYQAERGLGESTIRGVAKAIRLAEGYGIVLSSALYTEYDYQSRVFVYLHEFRHTQNWPKFPKLDGEPRARLDYLTRLYALYDEYCADRWAYRVTDVLFGEASTAYLERQRSDSESYKRLLTDDTYRVTIELQVASLGTGLPAWEKFMRGIQPVMADVVLVTSHAFALMHNKPELLSLADVQESKFINTRTVALMDYLKQKFDQNNFELMDGVDLCRDYTATFGYFANDQPDGSTHFRILNPWAVTDDQTPNL
jgi:hypothetical protein